MSRSITEEEVRQTFRQCSNTPGPDGPCQMVSSVFQIFDVFCHLRVIRISTAFRLVHLLRADCQKRFNIICYHLFLQLLILSICTFVVYYCILYFYLLRSRIRQLLTTLVQHYSFILFFSSHTPPFQSISLQINSRKNTLQAFYCSYSDPFR